MNTRILGGNPSQEKNNRCHCLSLQYFIIEKTYYNICAGAASYQHAGTHLCLFTSLSWKGATTP